MSKITLKPLFDDDQKTVKIHVGKTTIGRGPFLGCSNKRVSRKHAILEVTNKGEVYLTPIHVNPVFFQPTADRPGQILQKDIPHKLENGDSFSLLPRAFRYQLTVTGENAKDKSDHPGPILEKDVPHKLENDDSFSLLPQAFHYQLTVTGENSEDEQMT